MKKKLHPNVHFVEFACDENTTEQILCNCNKAKNRPSLGINAIFSFVWCESVKCNQLFQRIVLVPKQIKRYSNFSIDRRYFFRFTWTLRQLKINSTLIRTKKKVENKDKLLVTFGGSWNGCFTSSIHWNINKKVITERYPPLVPMPIHFGQHADILICSCFSIWMIFIGPKLLVISYYSQPSNSQIS